jgi:hypothetical protein
MRYGANYSVYLCPPSSENTNMIPNGQQLILFDFDNVNKLK